MKRITLAIVLFAAFATVASASDDGQTRPKLDSSNLSTPNTSTDIIATTSGAGNVKGVNCQNSIGSALVIYIYVNGGAAQTLAVYNAPLDSVGNTGWIPLNVRFTSSIRVQMQRPASPAVYGDTPCAVSWALD